jgi:nudix-type nucleoside diphosphatase (YffH/AdpP family)
MIMAKRVEILSRREVFKQAFFRIEEARLRHEKYDGTLSDEMVRLNFERGDSVAALIYDPGNGKLIFTEQFRYPTYSKGPGWLLEIPAGSIEPGETPEDTLKREIEEEIGYTISNTQHISTFYLSPGGTSERIHLYYVRVKDDEKTSEGGGKAGEHEYIRIVNFSIDEALKGIESGLMQDAKTLIGLQWLQLNRGNL